jgi:hypothetical protein
LPKQSGRFFFVQGTGLQFMALVQTPGATIQTIAVLEEDSLVASPKPGSHHCLSMSPGTQVQKVLAAVGKLALNECAPQHLYAMAAAYRRGHMTIQQDSVIAESCEFERWGLSKDTRSTTE